MRSNVGMRPERPTSVVVRTLRPRELRMSWAKPGRYDLVVVGASVHKVKHQKEIVDWVRDRRGALAQMPSFF
jgi:menaquinone-dependent protoporphyrinogen IX oxidase